MPTEYRVIVANDLFDVPSIWQNPFTRAKKYAAALERALNEMGADGWQLVESHHDRWLVFIFQRTVSRRREEQTGIQAAD